MRTVDLYHIESRFLRQLRAFFILLHQLLYLVGLQCPRNFGILHLTVITQNLLFQGYSRGGHRHLVVGLEVTVGVPADVPQLHTYRGGFRVHGVDHFLPVLSVGLGVYPRGLGVTLALLANLGSLADD